MRRQVNSNVIQTKNIIMMNDFCIVISGLPASGKSTLGNSISKRIKVPIFDKDDFLEKLYETKVIGDELWRRKLSDQSNLTFQSEALKEKSSILVSHWKNSSDRKFSGTPTKWILSSFKLVIELYCNCSINVAVNRFNNRHRHPGHLDEKKEIIDIFQQFLSYSNQFPLGIGKLIEVETDKPVEIEKVILNIQNILKNNA